MSTKIKKNPGIVEEIELGKDILASYENETLSIKGKKGISDKKLVGKGIIIRTEEDKIVIESDSSTKKGKKLVSSFKAHIKNMIQGCSSGHQYILKICSGHFPMSVEISSNTLSLKNFLGEKIPRRLKLKQGASVKLDGDKIIVDSLNKEIAGQVSADIEQLTRRPGYDTRIFQDGIYLINKDGKKIK